jgi:hypothetical protein
MADWAASCTETTSHHDRFPIQCWLWPRHCSLDQLLLPVLHRLVPFEQMHHVYDSHTLRVPSNCLIIQQTVSPDTAIQTGNSRPYCLSTATQEPPEQTHTFWSVVHDVIFFPSSMLPTGTNNFPECESFMQLLSIIKKRYKFKMWHDKKEHPVHSTYA